MHVLAGDFDTVIIERHFLARGPSYLGSGLDMTQKIWYAPALAHVVKIVSERGNSVYLPRALPGNVEATEVSVP